MRLASASAITVAVIACGSVYGQIQEKREARNLDDYQPIGLPVGSFRLFPSLTVGVFYDDDVLRTDADVISDTYFSILPRLDLNSDWNRHEVKLSVGADFRQFSSQSSENRTNWFAGAHSRIDVTRPLRVFLDAEYRQLAEERGSVNSLADALEPTRYERTNLGARFDYVANRFGVRGGVDYTSYSWDDTERFLLPPLDNADRDLSDLGFSLEFRYEFSPGYNAYISGRTLDRTYDQQFDRNGEARDFSAYFVRGGVAFELTDLLQGDIFVGLADYDFESSAFENIQHVDYGANLLWLPTELTSVRFKVTRSLEPATALGVPGVTTTAYGIGIDHELLRNLIVSADATFIDDTFEGSPRTDRTTSYQLQARYLMNRYIWVNARYNYVTRDSDLISESYDNNIFGLSVTAQF